MKRDPVCGRDVDPLRARAVAIIGGEPIYFCSREHRDAYLRRRAAPDDWDEPTPLPPIVAPDTEPVPTLDLATVQRSGGIWAFLVGLLRRFTL
jgi:YHS domain-containing protein